MIEAARRFQPERGAQFSTFASHWIKQTCQRFGPAATLLIHVPAYVFWPCFRHSFDVERMQTAGGPATVSDHLHELDLLNPRLAVGWRAYLRARNGDSLSDPLLLRKSLTIPDLHSLPIAPSSAAIRSWKFATP